jgi:biotin transporter BioY
MFIVAIGWMYVVLMMSIAEDTAVAGVMTFILYGLLPVAILLYLSGGGKRKRRRMAEQQRRAEAAANDEQAVEQAPPASGRED